MAVTALMGATCSEPSTPASTVGGERPALVAPGPESHSAVTTTPAIEAAPEAPQDTAPEPRAEAPMVRARVLLTTLGDFDAELAERIAEGLRAELQVEVDVLPGEALPRAAYYQPRRRYRADALLEHLNRRLEGAPPETRVLGLTAVDISTTKPPHRDWGVLGLGELGGRSCVISTFRMRRRGLRDRAHLEFRVVSTAVHEVGHTLGLEHCTEPRCVMNDARGTIATVDASTGHLGPECRAELDRESPPVHTPTR